MNRSNQTTKSIKYSAPAPGRTIVNSIKPWAKEILTISIEINEKAKDLNMVEELNDLYKEYFRVKTSFVENNTNNHEENIKLLSNAILTIWLTSVSTHIFNRNAKLIESIEWFFDKYDKNEKYMPILEKWLNDVDIQTLRKISYDEIFSDLYPYVLEVFETNYELFLKNGSDRKKKRNRGIYYTPSDVAYFMVKNIGKTKKSSLDILNGEWIDPACGTGLFLRTIVEYYINEKLVSREINNIIQFVTQKIYGIDISRQAIQSSIFTLLTYLLNQSGINIDMPWYYYQLIQKNHAVMDSTKLNRERIKKIFPTVKNGFMFFVANPPYSKRIIRNIYEQKTLDGKIKKVSINKIGDYLYLDFVRMIWSICNQENSTSAIVVPLSITFNSGKEFCKIREEIKNINGVWKFANFDRTPDSLFGDDVKTRNTIIFFNQNKDDNDRSFHTTTLLRWNSRNRKSFFNNIKYAYLGDFNIKHNIPKIGSDFEKKLYFAISKRKNKLKQDIIENEADNSIINKIYIGQTSYNWLSIYRSNPYPTNDDGDSYSTLIPISFKTENEANIVYGILSSRIVYWLWRVECDGFHLNKSFIKKVPISVNDLSSIQKNIIGENAIRLWETIIKKPIISNNSGVKSITYCPYDSETNIIEIDKTLLELLGFTHERYKYFKCFTQSLMIAGREDEMRQDSNYKI